MSEVKVDTISERTAAGGVTIDGVLLKDNVVNTDTVSEKTAAAGVTIDGVLVKDGTATFQTAAGSPLVFEGATADAYETTFAITDPTADRTITFPDASITLGAAEDNTPSWSAYNASTQSCTADTETVATLGSENWDTDSAFASNKFTVPSGEGGKYSISYGAKFENINASNNVRLYLRVNGTNNDYTVIGSADPDANHHYLATNVILNLSAADYVELIAYIATATDNIKYAHLSGFKLAGV